MSLVTLTEQFYCKTTTYLYYKYSLLFPYSAEHTVLASQVNVTDGWIIMPTTLPTSLRHNRCGRVTAAERRQHPV